MDAYAKSKQFGGLYPIPRYDLIGASLADDSSRHAVEMIHQCINELGRAVQLGQHRDLVHSLDSHLKVLGVDALLSLAASAQSDANLCRVLSIQLTCLEQTYHWPGEKVLATPPTLQEYKMVIQVVQEPELWSLLLTQLESQPQSLKAKSLAALAMAKTMFARASAGQTAGSRPLSRPEQDLVNLLNRTARADIWYQGDYDSRDCHKEMAQVHEIKQTHGTQRKCQELFEAYGGLEQLQHIPTLLKQLYDKPAVAKAICKSLGTLQIAVAHAREEMFSMMVDEVVWGHTFAKWSRAVGVSDVASSGSDCPLFWMLDGLIGQVDQTSRATLVDSLAFRSRYFPADVTAVIRAVASAPSLRSYVTNADASYALVQAWKGLLHIMYDLYEIHRRKAMRIIISLRTGSGDFTAEKVAEAAGVKRFQALTESLVVRFGSDKRALQVDALAWPATPSSEIDSREETEGTRIRFVLATPLAVSLGDTICVSVVLPQFGRQERTYSIARAEPLKGSFLEQPQLATSVEVVIQNRGRVSRHMCTQTLPFPVQVRVQSVPHFRFGGDEDTNEEHWLMAQAGSFDVFAHWLLGHASKRRYRLVIGVRSYSMLHDIALLRELVKVSGTLKIVVALSLPARDDARRLLSIGLEPYAGRVTDYVATRCILGETTQSWYVCGSAAFGLDVARSIICAKRCANDPQETSLYRFNIRLAPITTSKLPEIRLHVAGGPTTSPGSGRPPVRAITKIELALHNRPYDRWIACGNLVHDISDVAGFHPGGEKVLAHCGGRDAQEMLNMVHAESYAVDSVLNQLMIGRLVPSPDATWDILMDRLVNIQNDLEVQSRFEQTPTGCPDQIDRAPPVLVIMTSISNFAAAWTKRILQKYELPVHASPEEIEDIASRLHVSVQRCNKHVDAALKDVYTKHFHDLSKCATRLKRLYDHYYHLISAIHDIIDNTKTEIQICSSKTNGFARPPDIMKCTELIISIVSEPLEDCRTGNTAVWQG